MERRSRSSSGVGLDFNNEVVQVGIFSFEKDVFHAAEEANELGL